MLLSLHRTFLSFLKTTWKPGWQISMVCWLWTISCYKRMWVFALMHSHHILFMFLCVFSKLLCFCLLWQLCRMRKKQVSWSCWSLRFVTTLLFTLRSMMKSSNHIYRGLLRPSGIFWFLLARKLNMTWWECWSYVVPLFILKFIFPLLTFQLISVAAGEQRYPVLGISLWKATLQASIWGPEYTH